VKEYDVIIIGGGPAGISAAIYTGRAMLSTLLIEKAAVGGLIASSDIIENYPGFPEPIQPTELMANMEKQAKRFNVQFEFDTVNTIEPVEDGYVLKTDWDEFHARGIILATGSSPKKSGVPGEEKFLGRGITFCATCDGPFYKDKDVIIVGAGDSGVQEGLFLLNFVKSVTFLVYKPVIKASKALLQKVQGKENVRFILNSDLIEVVGNERLEGAKIRNKETGEESVVPGQGIFLYIGFKPNTGFLKGFVDLDEKGYIITDKRMATSRPKVYAAGDVTKNTYAQVAVSVGSGVTAAMSLIHDLEK